MVYTVTFNPALDYVMKVGSLKSDNINRAGETILSYGGKGINVSVILTRLGAPNRALGFIAGFTGKELERRLTADGVDNDFCLLGSGSTRINVKIKAETELDINAAGPPVSEGDIESLLDKLSVIESGDFLVLAGSVPENLPPDIYERIMKNLNGRGINFVIDASGELLKNVLKYRPFLIKPNHIELGELFGAVVNTDDDAVRYAAELQKLGARNVLVSRAEKGALLLDEKGGVHKVGAVNGTLVNSVGCGDSMVGGFIAGYLENGSFDNALRLGAACGTATAFSDGLAEKDEINRILSQI